MKREGESKFAASLGQSKGEKKRKRREWVSGELMSLVASVGISQ